MEERLATDLYRMRVYPMQPGAHVGPEQIGELSEEQIAVIFAMTSRRPEPFDEIQGMVTAEKAADFHERWVLNYGHASVAEHATLHMAVENVSRLACDTLEDNRLASYTEKSSRYQVFTSDYYHIPSELDGDAAARERYVATCDGLFACYEELVEGLRAHLRTVRPQAPDERDGTYNLRLRREATDTARFVLPTATLTNVGVTMNARSMEHAIRKLLSAPLAEERALGEQLKAQGREVTPTLIKYADRNDYIVETRAAQRRVAVNVERGEAPARDATLLHWDPLAERKIAAAFCYAASDAPYAQVWERVQALPDDELASIIEAALGEKLGPHDVPVRELEEAYLTFDFILDYGAYREFKRHRMQTYVSQAATTSLGYVTPPLIDDARLNEPFERAMRLSQEGHEALAAEQPEVAQYLVTHAHRRRVLATMNVRECFHLFKLRTQETAHFSLVEVMNQALAQARGVHPMLFEHLRLRD